MLPITLAPLAENGVLAAIDLGDNVNEIFAKRCPADALYSGNGIRLG
ncbi:MAG: hypothetical protein H6660_18655 [Ardenticatenaceae bacterium]|nr:hypothetical protein [Ardenticatenaceae bacterium]